MIFTEQSIKGVWVIEPRVQRDERGYFMESFRKDLFEQHIGKTDFIQDNESQSTRGVLRGLHYQIGEYSQAKLVRALRGHVLDIVVDLRKSSKTFGKYVAVELSEDNKKQLFVPRGFAHGFLVLSEKAVFAYKVDNLYSPNHDTTLLWNDPTINIGWNINREELILSEKDQKGNLLTDTYTFD